MKQSESPCRCFEFVFLFFFPRTLCFFHYSTCNGFVILSAQIYNKHLIIVTVHSEMFISQKEEALVLQNPS